MRLNTGMIFESPVTYADDVQEVDLLHHSDDPPDVQFDANFDNNDDDMIEDTPTLTNPDLLDEESDAINTLVNSLTVAVPTHSRATTLAKAALPDRCLDMSTFCTQNAHGLWQLVTESDGNRLSNQLWDMTRFKHLITLMNAKCLDVYFLQDTWLEDDKFDIDVGGYIVFPHNGPNGNHLYHGVAIVLSPCYYAGWKAAGAEPPITTNTASEFGGRFIGITIKLEIHDKRGCTVKGKKKKETSLVLSLVSAYHPCHTKDDHMQFLDIVDTLLSKLLPSEIVMGANLNANVGCALQEDDDPFAPTLGPHGPSKRNSKGKSLLAVYMSHGLHVMNTYYPAK
jgi:hypothetical protein